MPRQPARRGAVGLLWQPQPPNRQQGFTPGIQAGQSICILSVRRASTSPNQADPGLDLPSRRLRNATMIMRPRHRRQRSRPHARKPACRDGELPRGLVQGRRAAGANGLLPLVQGWRVSTTPRANARCWTAPSPKPRADRRLHHDPGPLARSHAMGATLSLTLPRPALLGRGAAAVRAGGFRAQPAIERFRDIPGNGQQ